MSAPNKKGSTTPVKNKQTLAVGLKKLRNDSTSSEGAKKQVVSSSTPQHGVSTPRRQTKKSLPVSKRVTKENVGQLRGRCKVVSANAIGRLESMHGVSRGSNPLRVAVALEAQKFAEAVVEKATYLMLQTKRQTITPANMAEGYRVVTGKTWAGKDAPLLPFESHSSKSSSKNAAVASV